MNRTTVLRGVAVIAVVLASGVAFAAASPDRGTTYTACVHNQTGNLRVVAASSDCKANERSISWNQQGPEGPAGPQGPAGAVASLDDLDGVACMRGAGTVEVTYGPDGAIALRCVSTTTSTTSPPTDCGALAAFAPRATVAYDDYPINGETEADQYRSFLRREFVSAVQSAADLVHDRAAGSTTGHGAPIGLGDMSECDGSIPGTSRGEPGHPPGTHTGGLDIDIAYYQSGTPDNHLRAVCESQIDRVEQNHCVAAPDRLDAYRTALFVEALASVAPVRVIGVDGLIGPVLERTLAQLCADGVTDCTPVPLAYETSDRGEGWFLFHHHNMHVSFTPTR